DDHRVGRQGTLGHRGGGPGPAAGGIGGPDRQAPGPVQRRLHGHGHGPQGSRPAPGHLYLELRRGSGVRTAGHGDYGAPHGMESPEQQSPPGGPAVPATRARPAAAARMAGPGPKTPNSSPDSPYRRAPSYSPRALVLELELIERPFRSVVVVVRFVCVCRFRLRYLPVGPYEITVRQSGFEDAARHLAVVG